MLSILSPDDLPVHRWRGRFSLSDEEFWHPTHCGPGDALGPSQSLSAISDDGDLDSQPCSPPRNLTRAGISRPIAPSLLLGPRGMMKAAHARRGRAA